MSTVCNYEHIAVILVSTVMKNDTVLDVMTFTHAATAPHTTLPGTFKLPTVDGFDWLHFAHVIIRRPITDTCAFMPYR